LIKRSSDASCQTAGDQAKRWTTRVTDIAACIRLLHGKHIHEASTRYGLSEALIIAVMIKESEGDPNAVSSSRCLGLMQILPSTARSMGIDLAQIFDPRTNILAGARVLRDYLDGARGDLDRALASYRLGPGAVNQRMKNENFNPSSFDYVVKVKNILRLL
jgi:soluble lytic murein transglycosylase-like protein